MLSISKDLRLFGLDLGKVLPRSAAPATAGQGAAGALSWLEPPRLVCLQQADGAQSWWKGREVFIPFALEGSPPRRPQKAWALPEALQLTRELRMPPLAPADLQAAVALQVAQWSPFSEAETLWAHVAQPAVDGQQDVTVVMSSRTHLQNFARQVAAGADDQVEIWAMASPERAVPLHGGTGRSVSRWWTIAVLFLILTALGLGALALVSPTWRVRGEAIQAVYAYDALYEKAGPVVAQREQWLKLNERIMQLEKRVAEQADPLLLLQVLTEKLPDDAWVSRLQISGLKVSASVEAGNMASLMQVLAAVPGLVDIKSPSGAQRNRITGKESFVLDFVVDPTVFAPLAAATATAAVSPVAPVGAPAASAAPATVPAPAAVSAPVSAPGSGAASAPAAAAAPAPIAPTPPPASSETTGGATFGGRVRQPK